MCGEGVLGVCVERGTRRVCGEGGQAPPPSPAAAEGLYTSEFLTAPVSFKHNYDVYFLFVFFYQQHSAVFNTEPHHVFMNRT